MKDNAAVSWLPKLIDVLRMRTKDEVAPEKFEEALGALQTSVEGTKTPEFADPGDATGSISKSEGDGSHHIIINVGDPPMKPAEGGDGTPPKEKGEVSTDAKPGDEQMCTRDELNEALETTIGPLLASAMKPVMDRIDTLEKRVNGVEEEVEGSGDPEDVSTQDAIARAEVLAPGLKIPTFDAKPGTRAHRDSIISYQRSALKQAWGTRDGKELLRPIINTGRPDFDAMAPEAIGIAFRSASQLMHDANASNVSDELPAFHMATIIKDSAGNKRGMTSADLAESLRKHYGRA